MALRGKRFTSSQQENATNATCHAAILMNKKREEINKYRYARVDVADVEAAPASFPDVSGRNVYISGPIEGVPNAAYTFALVHRACNDAGARIVFNPMAAGVQVKRPNWTREQHMLADLNMLTSGIIDLVLQLPGWKSSKGASLEAQVADECGIERIEVDIPPAGEGPAAVTNGRW